MVWIRLKVGINEDAVASLSRAALKRERDQVAKAAFWHRVLAREEAIVGVQAKLMAPFHSAGENDAAKLARGDRWTCTIKEDPDVATASRAGTLQSRRHIQLPACIHERVRIFLPGSLVEIHGEKPAGFVRQQWVNANGFGPQQMILNRSLGQREKLSRLMVDFLPVLRPAPVNRLPVLLRRRCISRPAIWALPSSRIHILSSAKKALEQCDSLSASFSPIPRGQYFDSFDARAARRFGWWNLDILFR